MTPAPAIGLFGKLPADGDFIQRGLPPVFLRHWEAWLGAVLAATRTALAEAWPRAYLLSPPWEFALAPGTVGESGWAGALASSIDRVGRCYPLTLVVATGREPVTPARLLAARGLTGVLRDGALALIESRASPEAGLAAIGAALAAAPAALAVPAATCSRRYRAEGALAALADDADEPPFRPALAGLEAAEGSLWWHGRWGERPPAIVAASAMPPPDVAAALFDGDWERHGWLRAGGLQDA